MTKKSVPEWRRFEKLVASIEAALANKAIVKSPDKLPDLQTGHLREVDASISLKAGTAKLLVTIECRKRDGPQDVTWIEQLATKKRRVGAASTIAVSSKGFSKEAIKVAAQEGITLRTLDQLDQENSLDWLKTTFITFIIKEYTILDLAIELLKPEPTDAIIIQDEWKELTIDKAPLFVQLADNTRYSAMRPWQIAIEKHGFDPFINCPEDGMIEDFFKWSCIGQGIGIVTNNGLKLVKYIYIKYRAAISINQVPFSNLFKYTTENKSVISEGAEIDLISMQQNSKLLVQKESEGGNLKISLIQS